VVFLDIDGVLAPIRRWDRYGDIEPACIEVLNEIVASARADVVVSSTRRHGKTVAELQAMLEAEGFTGRVVDKTPTGAAGARRGEEIGAWVAEHAVCGYVIIDDHIDMEELRTELVLTHPGRGYSRPTRSEPSRYSCEPTPRNERSSVGPWATAERWGQRQSCSRRARSLGDPAEN
jgi:hypothetical protein